MRGALICYAVVWILHFSTTRVVRTLITRRRSKPKRLGTILVSGLLKDFIPARRDELAF